MGFILIFLPQQGFSALRDTLATRYRHGLNTEFWQGGFFYEKAFPSLYRFRVSETLSSSRLQVSPREDKWKDQHCFFMDFSRNLIPKLSFNLLGTSLLFSDKQSGYVNDIQTHFVGIGATYRDKNLRIPTLFGVKEDRRFDQKDRGPSYRIGLESSRFDLGEYANSVYATYEGDNLDRRKNTSFGLSYTVFRQFYTETTDSLKLTLNRQRRDYYISRIGEVESRVERSQRAANILTYRLGQDFLCHLLASLSNRNLRINLLTGPNKGLKRERRDFKTAGSVHLSVRKILFRGDLTFSYSSEEQEYRLAETLPSSPYSGSSLLITPDNKSSYTALTLRTGWKFFPTDSLLLYSSLQRFCYDTPDPENFDDRDELRFRVNLQEVHSFSPFLTLRLALNFNLLHFVYIYGEKSADNNWTRILRFSPAVFWSPTSRWRFSHSAEVLANYVDYDYESLIPGVRSFLYRKFRLEDSTWVQLTPRTSLYLHYRLELDENGKFLWDQWLEQKLVDRRSHTFSLSLDYRPWRVFRIVPGYTFYSRKGYHYTGELSSLQEKDLAIDFRSHGPTLRIVYRSDRLRFLLVGNTIVTKTLNIEKQVLTRIDLNVSWTL